MTSKLPVPAPSQLPARRRDVPWIDDDTASYIDFRDSAVVGALGFFTGGGGHFYNRNWLKGFGLSAASLVALVAGMSFAPVLGVWALVGAVGAATALKDAKAINRFVLARNDSMRAGGGRLLSAMASANAQGAAAPMASAMVPAMAPPQAGAAPHQGLIDRLRQLAALRNQDMLNEAEYQDRKIDALSQFSGMPRDDVDDLLYALMPLVEEGTLGADDIEFAKNLGQ